MLLVFYVMAIYAGCNKAKDQALNKVPDAVMWGTIERIVIGIFCVTLMYGLVSNEFDSVRFFLKEILQKMEEISHG